MILVRAGIRGWTMHSKTIPGRPDFYFSNLRLAIFVDGCFWHACPYCNFSWKVKRNAEYWLAKLDINRRRDARVATQLRSAGIRVLRFWEHQLHDVRLCLQMLHDALSD